MKEPMICLPQGVPDVPARRVFVVDDHDTAEMFAVMLDMLGHHPRCAYGGKAALLLARDWTPDIVLLAVALPDMSGHDVARALRGHLGIARCNIIAMAAVEGSDDVARSLAAGCDRHFAKPIRFERLRNLLAVDSAIM